MTAQIGILELNIRLKQSQKYILLGSAVVVAILLYVQADRVGIDDTPWLLGVSIISILLFILVSAANDTTKIFSAKSSNAIDAFHRHKKAFDAISPVFIAISEKSTSFFEKNEMTTAFQHHALIAATKFAWMTTLLMMDKDLKDFRKSEYFEKFCLFGGSEVIRYLTPTSNALNMDKKSMIVTAATEMSNCTAAVDSVKKRATSDKPYFMNAIFELIENEFPISQLLQPDIEDYATRLDAAYGPLLRKAVASAS